MTTRRDDRPINRGPAEGAPSDDPIISPPPPPSHLSPRPPYEREFESAAAPNAPGWRWDPQRNAYEWWDGTRYTTRARRNGSSWSYLYFHPPPILTPRNYFAAVGFALAWLNIVLLCLLWIYLSPISLGLGVAGVVRAKRAGVMLGLSVATIILSLFGVAGGVFWGFYGPPFPST